jgi:methionine-rich copper-binding protein CopC
MIMASLWRSWLQRHLLVLALVPVPLLQPLADEPAHTAHTHITTSSPSGGSFLTAAPSEVRVSFDAEIRPAGSTMSVIAPGGAEVNAGPVRIAADRRTLAVPLRASLADGLYTVTWTAVAADGDEAEGSFDFGLRVGAQQPTMQLDRTTVTPGQRIAVSGTGFRPNGTVVISLGASEEFADAVRADGSGRLAATITVPADAEPGYLRVTAADGDGATARAEVQIGSGSQGFCRLSTPGLFGCP